MTVDDARTEMRVGLDEVVREGARLMLAVALEAEVDDYVTAIAASCADASMPFQPAVAWIAAIGK